MMAFQADDEVMDWLMQGDPAIRWQVQRDLLHMPVQVYEAERQRTIDEGWGCRLLALQDNCGTWGGGIYSPKWTSTTYTLLLLRRLGLPSGISQIDSACALLLENGFYRDHGINFSRSMKYKYSETCVSGMVLSILAFFRFSDERLSLLVGHLLRQQMSDHGWNCQSYQGARHSSFHTTISVLEGLYEAVTLLPGLQPDIEQASAAARQYLLCHRLFRSQRSGDIVDSKMTRFSFPPRWRYDVLRSLDYFQACRAERDSRLAEAVQLVEKKRRPDGRWLLQNRHPGRTFFELEEPGQPSRWNTLRALRVLQWWHA